MTINENFQWKQHPEAEQMLLSLLDECCQQNETIANLQNDLLKYTSTRLFDWVDHFAIGYSEAKETELQKYGFEPCHATSQYRVFHHPKAQLPRLVMYDHRQSLVGVAVAVESIADFLMVRGMNGWIEGSPFSCYRRCLISTSHDISLWVVERRATSVMEPTYTDEFSIIKYCEAVEKWQTRSRDLQDEDLAMSQTLELAEELSGLLGEDLAAWVILACERRFWERRNQAGQIQKNRQDRLGMGWANHDHHTFRSSRRHFTQLVRLFEMLGFHCRERFWAGLEAGWGAQVMENPRSRLVLFLDVDLKPDEIEVDFAHHSLPESEELGTIGLWCALHGDSILKAGMHHLEAQFMFDALAHDLAHIGVGTMTPFSNFTYLKQAFTDGEIWPVDPKRIQSLLEGSKITLEQAEKFRAHGAIGSHLENLQRREGYKGFNQKNVSFIIKETDPRKISV